MIDISAGKLTASLAPSLGGAVLRLIHDDDDILRPARSAEAVAEDPREAACFPCVPWFSRLAGGLDFDGRHYDLAPTLPACDPIHALHGEGWINPWEVTARSQDRLECRFDYQPRPGGFPFAFSAMQIFLATEQSFSINLSVANASGAPMPAGLALHPYFPRSAATQLRFIAGRNWAPDVRGDWRETATPDDLDFPAPRRLPPRDIDESFIEWNGRAEIAAQKTIMLSSDARLLHLYAPSGADFFCLEPLTQLPARLCEIILQPGEVSRLSLSIVV